MYFPCLVNRYGSQLHCFVVLCQLCVTTPRVNTLNHQTKFNIGLLHLHLVVSYLPCDLVKLVGIFSAHVRGQLWPEVVRGRKSRFDVTFLFTVGHFLAGVQVVRVVQFGLSANITTYTHTHLHTCLQRSLQPIISQSPFHALCKTEFTTLRQSSVCCLVSFVVSDALSFRIHFHTHNVPICVNKLGFSEITKQYNKIQYLCIYYNMASYSGV